MSEYNRRIFGCDFCNRETALSALPKEWFLVSSLNLLDTQFKDGDVPIAYSQFHACCECGHKLHAWMDKLGVQHNFVCHQYSDLEKPGSITIGF
jgi:hypothetical protein